jgi:hypothetical protein
MFCSIILYKRKSIDGQLTIKEIIKKCNERFGQEPSYLHLFVVLDKTDFNYPMIILFKGIGKIEVRVVELNPISNIEKLSERKERWGNGKQRKERRKGRRGRGCKRKKRKRRR